MCHVFPWKRLPRSASLRACQKNVCEAKGLGLIEASSVTGTLETSFHGHRAKHQKL